MSDLPDPSLSLGAERRSTHRLVTACMAVAVSGVVLASDPGRAQTTDTPTIQCAKWAAQPCVRVPVQAAPTVTDPTLLAGTPAPPRLSESVIAVAAETNRWIARTRWGGLYGP